MGFPKRLQIRLHQLSGRNRCNISVMFWRLVANHELHLDDIQACRLSLSIIMTINLDMLIHPAKLDVKTNKPPPLRFRWLPQIELERDTVIRRREV